MQRLCVFCGSALGNGGSTPRVRTTGGGTGRPRHRSGVRGRPHRLDGGSADAVLEAGGEAVGVIPQSLVDRELAHTGLTRLHVVSSMHQRKALMAELADAFAALPGGFGTADELFEMLTWAQLGLHAKPIGLLNVAGYFDSLLHWLDRAVREEFVPAAYRRLLLQANEPDQLLDLLESVRQG